MNFQITTENDHPTLLYAREELTHFLEKYSNAAFCAAQAPDRTFSIEVDPALEAHWFSLHTKERTVFIRGGSPASALAGVYELLTRMGIFFDTNGDTLPNDLCFAVLDSLDEVVKPLFKNRGIRQHINFPMDISSYPIQKAQEYIRSLARMQMNAITFHSYTGQWHSYQSANNEYSVGNYFYGQRHLVPDYAPVKAIVGNEKIFCIPECESLISDKAARGAFAVRWLNKLIATAKQCGMSTAISVEFPANESHQANMQIVRNVLESYSGIDAIELITSEGGGNGAPFVYEELTTKAVSMFGDQILENGVLPYMPKELPSALIGGLYSLKALIDVYQNKEELFNGICEKPIHVGLYIMCPETLKVLKNIMTRVLPADVILTFLPAHGSVAVAQNIAYMDFSKQELQRTMLYSWVEFDGNMYLQQNSSNGIELLMRYGAKKAEGESLYGACFNHWRTAENNVTIAYAAAATKIPMSTKGFYGLFAEKYSIPKADLFSDAMQKLEELDTFNRDKMFNIGFCYLGCWLNPKGLGWIRGWKFADLQTAICRYEGILEQLRSCCCAAEQVKGRMALRFWINRCACSILQIRCISKLSEIAAFADDKNPAALSVLQKQQVNQLCDEAEQLSEQYLDLHVKMLPDRGCEGTAVSYWATIPVYIAHIRQYFVYGEEHCTHIPQTLDAPPPPDTAYLE